MVARKFPSILACLTSVVCLAAGAAGGESAKDANAIIYAICDNSFEMRINKRPVLSGDKLETPVRSETTLKRGDVITVKCVDYGNAYGFSCVIKFNGPGGEPIASSVKDWKFYKPQSDEAWFDPDHIVRDNPAKHATNNVWKILVVAQSGVQCDSIWGDPEERVAYLIHTVE